MQTAISIDDELLREADGAAPHWDSAVAGFLRARWAISCEVSGGNKCWRN